MTDHRTPPGVSADPLGEGPGTRIGVYTLVRSIGEGGFGTVFEATQSEPVQRRVALKILKVGMDSREVLARFEQERQALALMDHAHIAKVLDAGTTAVGRPYFVMELVGGEPISVYCDAQTLSVRERLELFVQVCHAVQHAHQKGVIHRDIKPSNVLVATQDGKPHARVIDFGIAKATAARLSERTVYTEHGQVIGTIEYMSPEQAEGSLDIDTRTDVYSLGVLLYELLTSVTPFDPAALRSASFYDMMQIIREVEPPTPSTRLTSITSSLPAVATRRRSEPRRLASELRGELDWIVMRALEKERARRYETANAFADDILRFLAGEPVLAVPPSAGYRVRKFVRRHRVAVGAAGLVLVALLAGLGGTLWGLLEAKRGRTEAERQSQVADLERAEAQRQRAEAQLQRAEAQLQRSEAQLQSDEAARQRDAARAAQAELERVVEFQAGMLRRVTPFEMGRDLALDLRERVRATQAALELSDAQRERALAELDALLGGISMTDAARRVIDQNVLAPSSAAIAAEFADQPLTQATLHDSVAGTYQDLGLFAEAKQEALRAFDLRWEHLGPDERDTLRSQTLLGILSWQVGEVEESAQILRAVLPRLERAFGAEDPDALQARLCLGVLLIREDRDAEALASFEQILAIQERTLGPEHGDLALTLENIGAALANLGQQQRAIPVFERALAIQHQVLGPQDPAILENERLLAQAYDSLGRHEDADRLRRSGLETLARIKGANHPETIEAIAQLGQAYREQERFVEAEALARQALELRRAVLGDGHPLTIASLSETGVLCATLGRYGEAEALFAEAVERASATFGPDTIQTVDRISDLAVCYWYQGKVLEVEPLFARVLEWSLRTHGEDDPDTAHAMNNLAIVLQRLGRLDEAMPLYERALEINVAALGEDHVQTLQVKSTLANAVGELGDMEESARRFRDLLETQRRVLGEDHPDTLLARDNLAAVLRSLGRAAEAEELLLEALARRRRVIGAEHPETLDTLAALAGLYGKGERLAEARPLLEELLAARKRAAEHPDADPKVLIAYASNLLDCPLPELRDPQAALACARRANELTAHEQPSFLATLARAQQASGDTAGAAQTLRSALARLPPQAIDRPGLERELAQLEAAGGAAAR